MFRFDFNVSTDEKNDSKEDPVKQGTNHISKIFPTNNFWFLLANRWEREYFIREWLQQMY